MKLVNLLLYLIEGYLRMFLDLVSPREEQLSLRQIPQEVQHPIEGHIQQLTLSTLSITLYKLKIHSVNLKNYLHPYVMNLSHK